MCIVETACAGQGRLEGKVTIITGEAIGIGKATVRLFTKHGAKVIIANIANKVGLKLVEYVNPMVEFIHCDVSEEEDVHTATDLVIKRHCKLDIMFNNAGTISSKIRSAMVYDMTKFECVMNINVKGLMHGIKRMSCIMIPQKKGCIINTASIAGILGGVAPYSYTASKHAVIGLTKNSIVELGKILVNNVSPSGLETYFSMQHYEEIMEERKAEVEDFFHSRANLKGMTLKVEDIVEVPLYLAGEESKYVSRQNLVLDGRSSVVNHTWGIYQ